MQRSIGEKIAGFVVALGFAGFALFPLVWTLLTSFKTEPDIIRRGVHVWPSPATVHNYVAIWTQSNLPPLMWNSAVTATLTVLICCAAGTFAAYSASQCRFRGRLPVLLFFLLIRMFPAVLMVIPLFIILRNVGLLDTRFGLALAYTGFLLPIFIWMMKGFFDAVPGELEESARIDGCTRLGAMVRVILPLVYGGLLACATLRRHRGMERIPVRADADHQFGLTHLAGRVAVDGRRIPASVGRAQRRRHASALPVLVLFAIVQRAMVRGLATGAVKG